MTRALLVLALAALAACALPEPAPPPDDALAAAEVSEHIGAQLPLELGFTDEAGAPVRLGDVFRRGEPVVLVLSYYDCSMLCPLVLKGTAALARETPPRADAPYRVLTVSIDPRDTPADAAHMRAEVLGAAPPEGLEWAFWTGGAAEVAELAERVGFGYRYDARSGQFAHPAVAFVLTPEGRISRYLYGVGVPGEHFRAALTAAAAGETGSTFERVLQRCLHYVPALRRYAALVSNFFRTGGALVLLSLAGGVFLLTRRVRQREVG
jgi:protein SCO1/2